MRPLRPLLQRRWLFRLLWSADELHRRCGVIGTYSSGTYGSFSGTYDTLTMIGTYGDGSYGAVLGIYADLDGAGPFVFVSLEAISSATMVEATGGARTLLESGR